MFNKISGRSVMEYYPKKASTAFANGALVYADGSGAVQPADATSGMHFGVCKQVIVATDDDYASTTKIMIEKAYADDIYEVDVSTGTLTTAMIGTQCDLASSVGIDVTATSKNVVTIVGFISASKALVKINAIIEVANVATS